MIPSLRTTVLLYVGMIEDRPRYECTARLELSTTLSFYDVRSHFVKMRSDLGGKVHSQYSPMRYFQT